MLLRNYISRHAKGEGGACLSVLDSVGLGRRKDYDSRSAMRPKAGRARIRNRMRLGAPERSAGRW